MVISDVHFSVFLYHKPIANIWCIVLVTQIYKIGEKNSITEECNFSRDLPEIIIDDEDLPANWENKTSILSLIQF